MSEKPEITGKTRMFAEKDTANGGLPECRVKWFCGSLCPAKTRRQLGENNEAHCWLQ